MHCPTLVSRLAAALSLSLALTAQAPRKVAAPQPPVELDHKDPRTTAPIGPTHKTVRTPTSSAADRTPATKTEAITLPNGRPFAPRLPADRVLFDRPASGELWAEGRDYKARFTAQDFTYVPYFGADAPRDFPLALRLESARFGGVAAPLAGAAPAHAGTTVRIERGALTERYDLGVASIEQKFEVRAPFAGDLELTLAIDSELVAAADAQGLRFANEHGSVTYSSAVVVDALGNRTPMQTTHADGRINLRLGAGVLASLAFPLTVDPVLRTVPAVNDVTHVMKDADIAYVAGPDQFLVVWTRVFSASDTDLHALAVDAQGNVVANSSTLFDNGFDRWDDPRVASCGSTFLAVASRLPAGGGARSIWGRIRDAAGPTLQAPFQISGGEAGDKVLPDVGGEFDGPANYCVVWQRTLTAIDHDIHYRLVTRVGAPVNSVGFVNNAVDDDFRPRIADSSGRGPASNQFWPVTWQRLVSGVQHDVYIARIRWDGIRATGSFAIDIAADDDSLPSISSLTDGAGERHFLVAYTTNRTGNLDIYLRAFRDGTAPAAVADGFLGDLEHLGATARLRHQLAPQVDTDGVRFAIAYREAFAPTDHDAYVSTVDLTPQLRAVDSHQTLSFSGLDTKAIALVAQRSGGGNSLNGRLGYGVAFDHNATTNPVNSSIVDAIYSGSAPGNGFAVRATACGGLGLSTAGGSQITAPGHVLRFDLVSVAGPSLIVFGAPTAALPLCPPSPCALGATPTVLLPATSYSLLVPADPNLLGATLAVQGVALGATGGCAQLAQLVVSDTVDVTFR